MAANRNINVDGNSGVVAGNIDKVIINSPIIIRSSIIAEILKLMIDDGVLDSKGEKNRIYEVNEKIEFNNVIKYKDLIKEYYSFSAVCEQTIDKLDDCRPNSKNTILRSVNMQYKLFRGNYLSLAEKRINEMEIVRKNADNILDDMKEYYLKQTEHISSLQTYSSEEVELNIVAFMVYCFVECKILEKPRKEIIT